MPAAGWRLKKSFLVSSCGGRSKNRRCRLPSVFRQWGRATHKPEFDGEWVRLGDVVEASFAGEWGLETGELLTPVLRTANFNDDGTLDYATPAMRNIPRVKVSRKALRRGDIILEKSGGTPNRPVGIMAYYESDDVALCSNLIRCCA